MVPQSAAMASLLRGSRPRLWNLAQVPGFYDGVREGMLDAAVSRLEASDEFQLPAYQDSLGVPSFVSNTSQRCGRQPDCLPSACTRSYKAAMCIPHY